MTFINGGAMTVSPDGHWLVFPAISEDGMTRFWLRSLDTVEARALPGTEVAPVTPPAAWSFDSRYVLFSVANKLKKVDIQGGPTSNALVAGWDQSPDNKRFLFVATPDAGRPAPFTVVLNWAAGLKK
jgi:hypothetical protein